MLIQQQVDWVSSISSPYFSQCNGQYILGGYAIFNMNSALMRNFELPPHYRISIDLIFYRIDSWNNDKFNIYLDQQLIYQQAYTSSTGSNLCGLTSNDEIITISIQTQHNSNFAVIYMEAEDIDNDNDVLNKLIQETWGIRSFTLSIEPCPYACDYCESSSFMYCRKWSLQYWDQQIGLYDCNQLCSYTITLPQHNKVMIRFRLFLWNSYSLNLNIIVKNQLFASKSISYNLSFHYLFDITLPFFHHVEKRINIQIQRTGGTYPYIYIKDFQLLIEKDYEQNQFIPGCLNIIQNTCWECENGWILDAQICISNCGDLIVVGSEQCDDGNNIPFDGCYNCQFQCVANCLQCLFRICQECKQGYYLTASKTCQPIISDEFIIPYIESCKDQNTGCLDQFECFENCDFCLLQFCIPKCGDGFVHSKQEECDDGNDIQYDGCFQCKFDCNSKCQNCSKGVCKDQCQFGEIMIDYECESQCGDSIVTGDEECDDGNDEQYDGCYECKYQCSRSCKNCIKGICKDKCNNGDVLINNQCTSFCGNGIATGEEECDDGNNIQFDGCYQCKYSCPQFCDECEKDVCLECQEYFINQNNQCKSLEICGNGHVGDKEECDDGNTYSNDGCFNCVIQENWYCDHENPSYCFSWDAPAFILTFLNYTSEIQNVQLTFSQEVSKINNQISVVDEIIKVKILQVSDENQIITIYPINNITENLSYAEYIIGVQIYQKIDYPPILEITLDKTIVNELEMTFIRNIKQLKLRYINYLNPQQKLKSQTVSNFNQNIIYCLASLSIGQLIFGDSYLFQEILNTLQYISYLKFINVDFPENVVLFFLFSDLISITPLIQFLNINKYLDKIEITQKSSYTSGQFAFYQQDTNLISNLFCQFLQVIGLLILLSLFQIMKKLLYTKLMVAKYLYWISYFANKYNQSIVFFMSKMIFKLITIIIHSSKVFTTQSLIQILQLNAWDLLFKIFLYMSTIQSRPSFDYTSLSLCFIITSIYMTIILLQLTNILYFREQRDIQYQRISGLIQLIRQIILIALLAFFQFNQIIQTITILITNLSYILILDSTLIRFKQPKNYVQFIIEAVVVLFTLTSIFHFEDFRQYISADVKILIGFFQIGILCSSMVSLLLDQVLQKGKKILELIKKQKIKQVKKQEIFSL